MKNSHLWKPTKFEFRGNEWRITKDTQVVGLSSRFIAEIQLRNYESAIIKYAKGRMLDLGCGKIPLYGVYKDYINELICADWEGTFHKNEFIDIFFDLNSDFPIEDNEFDTILSTDVIEHLSNPENFWRETSRILRKEGILILGVPFFYKLHEEPYDYYRYTEFMIRKFCADNNFEIISLYPYGGSFEVFVDLFAKHLGWSKLLSFINYSLGKFISKSSLGDLIYKKTSSKFPLGYVLIAKKK